MQSERQAYGDHTVIWGRVRMFETERDPRSHLVQVKFKQWGQDSIPPLTNDKCGPWKHINVRVILWVIGKGMTFWLIENLLCYWQIREKYQVLSGQLIGRVIGANIENQDLSWPLTHGTQCIISSECNEVHFTEIAIAIINSGWRQVQISTFLSSWNFIYFFSNIIYYFNLKEQVIEMLKNNGPDKCLMN